MRHIDGFDFKHCLSISYRSKNSCLDSGCLEEGICRCVRIEDAKVRRIDFSKIVQVIHDNFFDSAKSLKRNSVLNSVLYGSKQELDYYIIDRILRINKIWNHENWDISIIDGYYGQEIDTVCLTNDKSIEIESQINHALNLFTLTEKVEYILNLEYGKILPRLKNCDWEIIKIDKSDVFFPSNSQLKRVSVKNLKFYEPLNYKLIRGVVLKDGIKWRLIDGYHRMSAISVGDFYVLAATPK